MSFRRSSMTLTLELLQPVVRQLTGCGNTNATASSNADIIAVDSKSTSTRIVQFPAVTATESCALAVEPNTPDRNAENRFLNVITAQHVIHGQSSDGQ